jgi:hypothetical protein
LWLHKAYDPIDTRLSPSPRTKSLLSSCKGTSVLYLQFHLIHSTSTRSFQTSHRIMSTSPTSRDSARNNPLRPSTPDRTRPSVGRTGSFSVAPKSEYLRNALQARRANNTPTSARDMRTPPPPAPKPAVINPATISPDGFDEFQLTDEHTRPVSPIRRRRPSDVGMPRSKTSRQLTEEIEKLKESLMTSNMRVELLKKNNSELQHTTTKLKERLEELEPLKDENGDLQDDNNHLRLRMQEMEEEMERVRHENDMVRQSNEEMLAIQIECSSHWEDQETAVQEAVDTIIALEKEKASLAVEVHKLKDRVSLLEDDTSKASTLFDGIPRAPSLVFSIDESRPSTSHFDSDYYSQSDSPQVKPSKESIISIEPSARSKKFLELTQERRRSVRDLAKRMSTASMSALRMASLIQAADIPEVLELSVGAPKIVEQLVADKRSSRAPRRYRERRLPDNIIQDALQISPTMPESRAPLSPTPIPQSLRRSYHSGESIGGRSSNDSRPSSSHVKTPTTATRSKHRQPSLTAHSPHVPSRRSSKQVHTNSSNEQMAQREQQSPRHRRSESDVSSAETPRAGPEEWASMPPPNHARSSLISESSLTSEVEAQDKDRWWRGVQQLTQQQQPQAQQYQAPPHLQSHHVSRPSESQQPQRSPTLTRPRSHHPDVLSQHAKTQPSTPAATEPYIQKDFMFNSNEDVNTFMRKAKARAFGRK